MKPRTEQLIADVGRTLKRRGITAYRLHKELLALAKAKDSEANLTAMMVANWMAGRNFPNSEYTLLLLEWREQKQNKHTQHETETAK